MLRRLVSWLMGRRKKEKSCQPRGRWVTIDGCRFYLHWYNVPPICE